MVLTRWILLSLSLIVLGASSASMAQSECWSGAEKNGDLCYPKCKAGYTGNGPVCWQNCPPGYADDGATCRKNTHIISANNSSCPWYDKCGLALAKGCSICPAGFANDGCTCRKDVHIVGKDSYGRGAGYFKRSVYRDAFRMGIDDHRRIWLPRATSLTAGERTYLLRYFPVRLVNGMRVFEMSGMTGAFNFNASATTYGKDFITIKKGKRSLRLLKHEMVHACQYEHSGGPDDFAREYADQFVDNGYSYDAIPFEMQAYAYQRMADDATPAIGQFLGYCYQANPLVIPAGSKPK